METLRRTASQLRVVVEVTERALLTNPSALLETVAWARRYGCGVALDDVGANINTMALLPFVAPDVIKLDAALICRDPTLDNARTVVAVMEHVERTGATILAEGIETTEHRRRALSYGAELGQGWLSGRPGALPGVGADKPGAVDSELSFNWTSTRERFVDRNKVAASQVVRFLPGSSVCERPSDLFDGTLVAVRSSRGVVAALTRMLEQSAVESESPVTVLASFAETDHFTSPVRARFARLANIHPFVAIAGLPEAALPQVHSVPVGIGEQRWGEWTLAIVGPTHAVALIARAVGGDEFEYALTQRREVVLAACRSLIARVLPESAGPSAK